MSAFRVTIKKTHMAINVGPDIEKIDLVAGSKAEKMSVYIRINSL